MTNYLFIKVTENTLNSQVFQNLAPLVDSNYSGTTLCPSGEKYKVFALKDNLEKFPVDIVLKTVANVDSNFVSPGVSDSNAPNVIFSSLYKAPSLIYAFNTNPEYLAHEKYMAEDRIQSYINNPLHQSLGTTGEYHENSRYQEIDLYNSFHQEAPVHVIGSDDAMSWIHSLNLA